VLEGVSRGLLTPFSKSGIVKLPSAKIRKPALVPNPGPNLGPRHGPFFFQGDNREAHLAPGRGCTGEYAPQTASVPTMEPRQLLACERNGPFAAAVGPFGSTPPASDGPARRVNGHPGVHPPRAPRLESQTPLSL